MVDVASVGMDDSSHRNILAWQWKQMNTVKLVLINYSDTYAKGRLCFKGAQGEELYEELTNTSIHVTPEMKSGDWEIEIKPYESLIFTYTI